MTRRARFTAKLEVLLVLVGFSLLAYLIVPVSFGDKRVYVPEGRDLDAIQACLLTASGMDKLVSDPLSFYDTAVLYPDRNQLRSTEPFLGYAVLGLPLRVFFRLGDVSVFEVLRWAIVLTSLVYAYLLFRAAGIGVALSLSGAVVCLSPPGFLDQIERLQVICIPLILPVLYHGLMVWKSGRLLHSAGLCFFVALYPLCGAINAAITVMAVLFVLPLVLNLLADLRRRKRLAILLVPIVLAAALDGLVLAPWLLDRSDLQAYVTDGFLLIKHWNPTNVALRIRQIPQFLGWRVGWTLTAAFTLLSIFVLRQWVETKASGRVDDRGAAQGPEKQLCVLLVTAFVLVVAAAHGFNRHTVAWLGILFDIVSVGALLMYWRGQIALPATPDEGSVRQNIVMLSGGLAVFLCLMSFGPVYASNTHPLATWLMRVLLAVMPPLKSIREYDRIWAFGMLFLSVYATVRLAMALRTSSTAMRTAAAAVTIAVMMASLHSRQLVASAEIEAPRDFVALALKSPGRGAIYVHPVMKWNTRSGVLMIAIARKIGRPIVNGSLGICPPWFIYATNVLHRFPDPEALWLLRRWKVQTVVGVTGDVVGSQSEDVTKVYEGQGQAIWEIRPSERDEPHPSAAANPAVHGLARIEHAWSRSDRTDSGRVSVDLPKGFAAQIVEVRFGQSIVQPMPDEIVIYASEGSERVRLNRAHAGEWIESLTADALLRRESPVAAIELKRPVRRELQIEFRNSDRPPIERIVLIGEWSEDH
jgi:hypothetical protein